MLSRRIFRQLTDSVLFDVPLRPLCQLAARRIDQPQSPATSSRQPTRSQYRCASSQTAWKTRQASDPFVREAKVKGLMSRAAFKLIQLNDAHKIFKSGQTVVDLGYAPGSWSQVAITNVGSSGRVVGIDIVPAQPPKGVSTIQGNFLSANIQAEVRDFVRDPEMGRLRGRSLISEDTGNEDRAIDAAAPSSINMAQQQLMKQPEETTTTTKRRKGATKSRAAIAERDRESGRVVDVVLSDMSAPWAQMSGLWVKSISDPYRRMMNTSGNNFRDHAGSMDLCNAALTFCYDTLKTDGSFVCKYYQGAEEKAFETRLKKLFKKVSREKPESSRSESKEAYFVAVGRKENADRDAVLGPRI